MGYSTDYFGSIKVEPSPDAGLAQQVNAWLKCRHVQYDVNKIYQADPEADNHTIDGNPVGENGWNWIKTFIDPNGDPYEPYRPAVAEYNYANPMPSLWSDLELETSLDGSMVLQWNGSEKSYEIMTWIQILIQYVFGPNGYILNGDLRWEGEDRNDNGTIHVVNNVVNPEYY